MPKFNPVGLWMTEDKFVRHRLLPDGRFEEARGLRENAYKGRYRVEGTRIRYEDESGLAADGEFRRGLLHHAGMILFREADL